MRLAKFYRQDFTDLEMEFLKSQLQNFIQDVRKDQRMTNSKIVKSVNDLSQEMVQSGRNVAYALVYRLLCLVLLLPVSTATVERSFSAMKIVKERLRNRMGDEWLYHLLVIYIEKELLSLIENEAIITIFMKMKARRSIA